MGLSSCDLGIQLTMWEGPLPWESWGLCCVCCHPNCDVLPWNPGAWTTLGGKTVTGTSRGLPGAQSALVPDRKGSQRLDKCISETPCKLRPLAYPQQCVNIKPWNILFCFIFNHCGTGDKAWLTRYSTGGGPCDPSSLRSSPLSTLVPY